MLNNRLEESGQAIIEFLVTITIILTMLFVFVQISWAVAFGHFAHYGVYMASRAYFASSLTQQSQMDAATIVLKQTVKRGSGDDLLPFIAKSRTGGNRDIKGAEPVPGAFIGTHPSAAGQDHIRAYSWADGVQYNFKVPVFLLPLAGWAKTEGNGQSIQMGTNLDPSKEIQFDGTIPFTSDSFLGREPSFDECFKEMTRISGGALGFSRGDGQEFIEDNGC